MKHYCEACQLVFEGEVCPACGSRKVREPSGTDLCFLCQKPIMWAEMAEDVLTNNGIPFLPRREMGLGLSLNVGPMNDHVRIYVPYDQLARATELMEGLFTDLTED